MEFIKMQGAGNDYVYVDVFRQSMPDDPPALARKIANRHFGVGADGLILIAPSEVADARMIMFNADGSEAEMCGNGIRCCAKYIFDYGIKQSNCLTIQTGAGVLSLDLQTDAGKVRRVTVDMGEPILQSARIPTTWDADTVVDQPLRIGDNTYQVTCVSMGNPHCVTFVDEITDEHVLRDGPRFETDVHFPQRVNVEFVRVISNSEVQQRTWERGSGETLACGTGASAVCVAGVLTGRTDRKLLVHLQGGDLELHWNQNDNRVYMTGPAVEVFRGQWPD